MTHDPWPMIHDPCSYFAFSTHVLYPVLPLGRKNLAHPSKWLLTRSKCSQNPSWRETLPMHFSVCGVKTSPELAVHISLKGKIPRNPLSNFGRISSGDSLPIFFSWDYSQEDFSKFLPKIEREIPGILWRFPRRDLHIKAVTSCSTHKIDQQETDG